MGSVKMGRPVSQHRWPVEFGGGLPAVAGGGAEDVTAMLVTGGAGGDWLGPDDTALCK